MQAGNDPITQSLVQSFLKKNGVTNPVPVSPPQMIRQQSTEGYNTLRKSGYEIMNNNAKNY
jgi:hypothetical protein